VVVGPAVLLHRLLNVLLVAPLPLVAHLTVARLRPGSVAAAAAFLPFLFPQVGFLAGTVNNDNLSILAYWVATLLVVRVLTGDRSLRTAVLLGGTIAVAAFTKAFGLFLLPWAAVAYAVASAGRWRDTAIRIATVGVVSFLGVWWYLRALLVEGDPVPEPEVGGLAGIVPLGPEWQPGVAQFLWGALRPLAVTVAWHTGTGSVAFGLGSTWALWWIGFLLVLAVLGLVVAGPERAAVAVLLGLVLVKVLAVLPRSWNFYSTYGQITGVQGRYLFGAVLALGVAALLGVGWLSRRRPGWTPALVALPLLALSGLVGWRAWRGYWGPEGGSVGSSWSAFTAWSPLPVLLTTILVAALCTAALATTSAVVWFARQERLRVENGNPTSTVAG